jgi:UDP-N-acetylmuramoyl-tripeptide--D-alanyl-D-alanine ligase
MTKNILEKYCKKLSDDFVQKFKDVSTEFSRFDNDTIYLVGKQYSKKLHYELEKISTNSHFIVFDNEGVGSSSVSLVAEKDRADFTKELLTIIFPIVFDEIKIMGVTGTNGKSTTVHLLDELLRQKTNKVLVVGTVGVFLGGQKIDYTGMTSPGIIYNWKTIYKYKNGIDYVVYEVSSHGLDQDRFYGIPFDSVGWTSFSQDHLDYHENMQNYYNSKFKIKQLLRNKNLINTSATSKNVVREDNKKYFKQIRFDLQGTNLPEFLKFNYNKENLRVAIGMLEDVGLYRDSFEVNKLTPPEGRLESIQHPSKNTKVFVDYAHTPDALINVLDEMKKTYPNHQIVTVFGCGGNRDKSKRSLMYEEVIRRSDTIVITNDNPREEDPEVIVKDIKSTDLFNEENTTIELDRSKAIELAINNYDNSIVLVAGKGHEKYIDQGGVKSYFSDYEIANNTIFKDSCVFIEPELITSLKPEVAIGNFYARFKYTVIDSRDVEKDTLFLAFDGEKVDGFKFVEGAIEKGANGILFEYSDKKAEELHALSRKYPHVFFAAFVGMEEVTYKLAKIVRNLSERSLIISISGSNGKTTTKEMLFHGLENLGKKAQRTLKNNNNKLGLSLTLLQLRKDTEFLVLELGSNHPGEIQTLCELSEPDICYTTNIGETHLEFFPRGVAGVLEEEGYPSNYVEGKDDKLFICNDYDEYLSTLNLNKNCLKLSREIKIQARNQDLKLSYYGDDYQWSNEFLIGDYNYFNVAVSSFIIHKITSIAFDEILNTYNSYKSKMKRSQWLDWKGASVWLDAYNANPSSMKLALKAFAEKMKGKDTIVIIGEMKELGEFAVKLHEEMGKFLNSLPLEEVWYLGDFYNEVKSGYKNLKKFESTEAVRKKLEDLSNTNQLPPYIMLKASRSLQLESIIDIT